MASSYTFTFKPEKQMLYYRVQLLVVLLHFFAFVILAIRHYPDNVRKPAIGMLAALVFIILNFTNKNRPNKRFLMDVPLYLLAVWWLTAGVYWMAVLVLVFAIFATLSKQKIQVIFSAEQITCQSFPKRVFNWADLNDVILKDGLLTIDFKNNKIIQQLVEEVETEENEFNGFCKRHLQAATPTL